MSRWQRAIDPSGVEVWELVPPPTWATRSAPPPRWTVYVVRTLKTRSLPTGELWRGMRDGAVVRKNHRVRTWKTRAAAFRAVAVVAEIEAGK